MESCGDLSWEDPLEKHEDLSDCEPDSCAHVRVVPDVTDVPVSPSVVTDFCEFFFRVALIGKMLYRSPFLSSKREHFCCTSTQEETRYGGQQGKAPAMAHTSAIFARPPLKGSRSVTEWKAGDKVRRKERSSRGGES